MKENFKQSLVRLLSNRTWLLYANIFVLLVGLWFFFQMWRETESAEILQVSIATLQSKLKSGSASPASEAVIPLPPPEIRYMEDVSEVLNLANVVGLPISSVAYQEQEIVGAFSIRSMEIKTVETYPRAKLFSAQVLAALPNANLSNIRIDRQEEPPHMAAITLRFVMVYQTSKRALSAQAQGRALK